MSAFWIILFIVFIVVFVSNWIMATEHFNYILGNNMSTEMYNSVSNAGEYVSYNPLRKCLMISNQKCLLIYDIKIEIMDLSKGNNGRISKTFNLARNTREKIFYDVCNIFNAYTTYEDLIGIINKNKTPLSETIGTVQTDQSVSDSIEEVKGTFPRTDVNSASEEELTMLPGINIIYAKKIIKRREEIGGYKNLNEFFEYINVSKKIESILRGILTVKEMVIEDKNLKFNERNIDL